MNLGENELKISPYKKGTAFACMTPLVYEKNAGVSEPCTADEHVDPHGALKAFMESEPEYVFTEDNKVQFSEVVDEKKYVVMYLVEIYPFLTTYTRPNRHTVKPLRPSRFCRGQFVELEFSVRLVSGLVERTGMYTWRFVHHLHSIVLLSRVGVHVSKKF